MIDRYSIRCSTHKIDPNRCNYDWMNHICYIYINKYYCVCLLMMNRYCTSCTCCLLWLQIQYVQYRLDRIFGFISLIRSIPFVRSVRLDYHVYCCISILVINRSILYSLYRFSNHIESHTIPVPIVIVRFNSITDPFDPFVQSDPLHYRVYYCVYIPPVDSPIHLSHCNMDLWIIDRIGSICWFTHSP